MSIASPGSTLRDEQTLMGQLLDLMKQEQQLLISADAEGLDALTPQKAQLATRLAMLAAERHKALGVAGFAVSEDGMQAWFDAGNDPADHAVWQALLQVTREAKEYNRVNGMLINKHMTHNQTILNALRTPAGGSGAGIYGPTGQTTVGGPSRRFVVG